jgi:riboflavin biosynthesis pyrimidine reductase
VDLDGGKPERNPARLVDDEGRVDEEADVVRGRDRAEVWVARAAARRVG